MSLKYNICSKTHTGHLGKYGIPVERELNYINYRDSERTRPYSAGVDEELDF